MGADIASPPSATRYEYINPNTYQLMRKAFLNLILATAFCLGTWAQTPFRLQRYNSFEVMPVNSESIVFIGNSITNMHDWFEAFNDPHIVNRGVSAAVSTEVLDNLESVLVAHPRKIFLMIGTNDLNKDASTPEQVAQRVRSIIVRCLKESPQTELYVQSILPSNNNRTPANQQAANELIRQSCEELGATYIDLWDDLQGILDGSISLDRLHLKASGYRIWCNKIAPYMDTKPVYKDEYTDIFGGLTYAFGNYCSFYGMMPISKDDVIFLGDCTVNTGEWHELLQSGNVKKRASSWDIPGIVIDRIQPMLSAIFTGNGNKQEPRQVLIELGYQEAINKMEASAFEAKYKDFVDEVRKYCPNTRLTLLAIYPTNDATVNTNYIVPFNARIKALAEGMTNTEFVEGTYTELVKNGVADTDYYSGIYLQGRGFAKFARIIAPYIPGTKAVTDDEALSRLATFNARTTLAKGLTTLASLPVGDKVGQYSPYDAAAALKAADEAYALLAKDGVADEQYTQQGVQLSAAVAALLPNIIQPTASTDVEEHWYQLYTPNRESKYTTSQGAGKALTGAADTKLKNTMWKFVKRTDGKFDIVNRKDGSFINPASPANSALSTSSTSPASGWTLSYSDAQGTFIITSGTVQMNQTNNSLGYALYNWGGGSNRSDTGCQFAIVDAPEPADADIEPFAGEYEISFETGNLVDPLTGTNATLGDYVIGKLWQSDSTMPKLTFSTASNNIMPSEINTGKYLMLHPGAKGCTYTLTVNDGCIITGYSFTYSAGSSVSLTSGGKTFTATTAEQQACVDGLTTPSVDFTMTGTNSTGHGLILKDFQVKVQSDNYIAAIAPITTEADNAGSARRYDLQGRPVRQMDKGKVYIVNRKKVIR